MLRYVAKHLSEGDLTQPDASKPRSLAGMDRLCLPQIAKDFPEFNWSEWKAQIETELRKKLEKEYQKIHIHRTVISRYQKEKGLCRILCESAVEYEEMTEYEKSPEMQSELHSNLIQTVMRRNWYLSMRMRKQQGQRFRLSVETAVHRFRSWG